MRAHGALTWDVKSLSPQVNPLRALGVPSGPAATAAGHRAGSGAVDPLEHLLARGPGGGQVVLGLGELALQLIPFGAVLVAFRGDPLHSRQKPVDPLGQLSLVPAWSSRAPSER